MIDRLIEFSLKNRIVILLLGLCLSMLGVYMYRTLPVDVYPDMNAPVVVVVTESPGMAPEDMETLVTFPLESGFISLPRVKDVRSNSMLGLSKINVEFELGTDIYFARQLVMEKLQMTLPSLPEGIESPFIGPISSMFADALEFTLYGDDLTRVRDYAEWIMKPRLQTVPGVSNVVILGGYLKQIHVLLDPRRMLNFDIRPARVIEALQDNNVNSSGGFLLQGAEEKIIRGLGRIQDLDDVRAIVLKTIDGVPVTIGEVADVEEGAYIRRGTAGEGGRECVIITVQNQYNANVMKTIRGVETVLDEFSRSLPEGWTLEPFYNQMDMIHKSIGNVITAIIMGAFLVIVVLWLFLNHVRSTLTVALVIPLSTVFSFLFFHVFGLTLNIMTLGGLAIGLGMIVDSSIIMVENIFRHIQEGEQRIMDAVVAGAKEVGHPIFYAVLILLAVFGPIFTLHGIEGKMFIPLVFAVSAAVASSLLISLTLTPVLASFLFRRTPKPAREGTLIRVLRNLYDRILSFSMARPALMIILCVLLFLAGVGLSFRVGSEFMPEIDESSLLVDVLLPPETSLEESSRISSLISSRISEIPDVRRVIRATGKARGAEHTAPVNLTHSSCVLVPKEKRRASVEDIKEEIRRVTQDIPGALIQIHAPLQHRINHVITGIRSAIAVKVFGENIQTIHDLSMKVEESLAGIRGVADLQMEPVSGVPQLEIHMQRRKLARYGLNVQDVSGLVEIALNGKVATELIETHKRYEIFVRYSEDDRNDIGKIQNMLILTPDGFRIPLREVCEIKENTNPPVIRRENALRRGVVQCNVAGRDMGSVVREIKGSLEKIEWPEGYFYTFGGTYENQIRALRQLTLVVLLTIAIVFFLLIISFNSFRQALLILINIPLALSGGMIILAITGFTLSVPSIVGFIALIGIAVQDGIVLVSHVNAYRAQGLDAESAIRRAGRNKLRPVLMTSFTTMLGLLPLALRNVTGSEMQRPLAIVIIFGLVISTLLTLVVLPSLYVILDPEKKQQRPA